jgi:hypothetical protein
VQEGPNPSLFESLMNNTYECLSFNVWERFLHSLVLEQTESDLSKINWLRGIIQLHSNSAGALRQVFIVSHSYQNPCQTKFLFQQLQLCFWVLEGF